MAKRQNQERYKEKNTAYEGLGKIGTKIQRIALIFMVGNAIILMVEKF